MDPGAVGVTRRQFFNRSIVGLVGLGAAGFGGAVLAFVWPSTGGFGSKMDVGNVDHIRKMVRDAAAPLYVKGVRSYIVEHDDQLLALYQKCTHLGCKVPFCETSQWFECGCHAAMFNLAGEWTAGPAPRGLDRFPVEIVNETVIVDTGTLVSGPAQGTYTGGNEPSGPHCIS